MFLTYDLTDLICESTAV